MSQPIAVYIHTPFCPSKCGYCDFNSYAMSGDIMARTVNATIAEIRRSPWAGTPAKTIFFGGGTPTYLETDQLLAILKATMEIHPPIGDAEITSEANPGTADAEKFSAMRKAGFNRISLGAQSFLADDLIRLGRVHGADEIGRAVATARTAGFNNLNLDLMFALPGQSVRAWRENLNRAIELNPEHLSLYCLTLEPNTPFYKLHLRGALQTPDDDAQVAMYEEAVAVATACGYAQYEISNFSKPGLESQHNLCYWRNESYAAYGPGAVGCMNSIRYTNLKHPDGYCAAVEAESNLWCEQDTLTTESRRLETLMLGLRLNEGLDVNQLELSTERLDDLSSRGWIKLSESRLRLTAEGRHFCSEVALILA